MLRTWFKAKKHLRWNPDNGNFSKETTPRIAIAVLEGTGTLDAHEPQLLLRIFKEAKIRTLGQLHPHGSDRVMLEDYCRNIQMQLTDNHILLLNKLQTVLPVQQMDDTSWSDSKGWSWTTDIKDARWNLKPLITPSGNARDCWKDFGGLLGSYSMRRTDLQARQQENTPLRPRIRLSNSTNLTPRLFSSFSLFGDVTGRNVMRHSLKAESLTVACTKFSKNSSKKSTLLLQEG
ncbi:hypothetical protein R1sor_026059 [Riccia sorocarpa]|uniref:Uncharacterized protein n=1 Tax=Riccia sorocarpa TaxID=122646 RepID=A0ABD3GBW0_9MARC